MGVSRRLRVLRRTLRPWWVRWIVVPILVPVALYAGWTLVLAWQFHERLDELRAAGEPVDLRELAPPPVPDSNNGEALLKQAIAWYDEHLAPTKPAAWFKEDWDEEDIASIREWCGTGDRYVELLARALATPALRLTVDWEAGFQTELWIVKQVPEITMFLSYRVRVAESATREAAVELGLLLDFAAKLGRSYRIEALMRWESESIAVQCLEDLSSKPGFNAREVRRELDGRFLQIDDPSLPRDVLRNERVLWISFSRRWIDGESPARILGLHEDHGFVEWLLGSCLVRPFAYRAALRFLDTAEQGVRLACQTPRKALPEATELSGKFDRTGPFMFACRQFADDSGLVIERQQRHQAVMRVARVGLALLELRQETGRWPASLDAVVPLVGAETIIDPYNGDRLQYEPGVRVEAMAPNPNRLEDWEVVWRFPQ